MLKITSQAWFEGLCSKVGIQPRKPKRVRANMLKRDAGTQQLEQRVVLSAVSGVNAAADQNLAVATKQAGASSTVGERHATKTSTESRLRSVQSQTKVSGAKLNGATSRVAVQRQQEFKAQRATKKTNSARSTTAQKLLNVRSSGVQTRLVNTNQTSSVRNIAIASSLKTPLRKSLNNSSSSLGSGTSSLSRLSKINTASTQALRVRSGSLANSSLVKSSQKPATSTSTKKAVSKLQSRTESAVQKHTEAIKNQTLSFGVHESTSFSDRISNANNVSFVDRIGHPSDFGLTADGSSSSSIDAFWASYNRNYSKLPSHASVNGLG